MSFDQDPNEQANISGADLAQMINHIKELESKLAASEEARKKAEENSVELAGLLNEELGGSTHFGEPAISNDITLRLRELDNKGYQPLTGAIGDEAARTIEYFKRLIEDSRKQEPAATLLNDDGDLRWNMKISAPLIAGDKLFASPIIPPSLKELQRENAELRKQLEAKVPEGFESVVLRSGNYGWRYAVSRSATLLRDIDRYGLKQGGEQYPNGLCCHDMADRLDAMLAAVPKESPKSDPESR